MALNPDFGFSKAGVNQSVLVGPAQFNQHFYFLQSAYLGLQQGPMVSDLFQVMNPEEILAASVGWALSAKARDISIAGVDNFYSAIVSRAFGSYGRILNNLRAHASERGVAPFTRCKGDLAQRVAEVYHARPRVREILSKENLVDGIQRGLYEGHFNSDARTTGPSNRAKYARAILAIMRDKYAAFQEKRPIDFYLGEARIALAQENSIALDNLLTDRLPIMLENSPDDSPCVREYSALHDSICAPRYPRQTPPQS